MKTLLRSLILIGSTFIQIATAQSTEAVAVKNNAPPWALSDANNDGWDDFRQSLFPQIDVTQPSLDGDHDGRSNYEEMLDFSDPNSNGKLETAVSEAVLNQASKAVAGATPMSDAEKRKRFKYHALGTARGTTAWCYLTAVTY